MVVMIKDDHEAVSADIFVTPPSDDDDDVSAEYCEDDERWLMFKPRDSHLSTDETMIPYHGKHGSKQHIHGKSIRFGYKMWPLATHSGCYPR